MNKRLALGFLALLSTPALAVPQSPSLLGNWARADGVTKISIAKCGASLCATNTWAKDPKGDEKVGDKLVMTLKPKSDASYEGEAFDQRRNLHYKMTVSLQQSSMKTEGCVLGGIICKDANWTRIQ